ncbi:MAG: class I SAM-dependent methyltransferase [Chloroflexi bacterium]|nr:class I SAM-dependent methyltransferase [Chloroflexota bacterium]
MSASLGFDRAVSYYDKSRAIPDWVSSAVTDSIIELGKLTPRSRVLEIGIGTGRIALPVLKRGLPVWGIDLSLGMMAELQTKIANRDLCVTLAQADANALPFPDASFDCVYAVHVYHLVANWQKAVRDAWRTVKRGGCFLVTYHKRDPQSPNAKLRRRLFELAKEHGIDARRPGSQSYDELRSELDKLSPTQLVEIARWLERTVTVSQILGEISKRLFSDTWMIPENVLPQLMPSLRDWAQREFGRLDYAVREEEEFSWMVLRKA